MSELPQSVANDAGRPLDINLVGQSPHVFAYRMWFREPEAEEWTEFAAGDTEDDVPDHHVTGPHPDGTHIVMNVAVGGRPNSTFRFVVTFVQGGQAVQGGTFVKTGKTGPNGGGGRKLAVILV
jgi:hypothetical protein